jgi:hypothetical protein
MRSRNASFKLFKSIFKPARNGRAHYLGGLALCTLSLLIFSGRIVHGQALNSDGQPEAAQPAGVVSANGEQFSNSNVQPITDATTIMRQAKLIYVRKKSVYFKAPELENELRKRPEFQRWGLSITRNEADADLIIEVGRKVFTTRFIYTVIDPRTDIIVTSGKLSSVGGTLATKIAKRFIEQMQQVRP